MMFTPLYYEKLREHRYWKSNTDLFFLSCLQEMH